MPISNKNYYRILQVDPTAEQEVIIAAYRRLALKYHPDINKSPDTYHRMQEINEAYEVLSNPARRAQYDKEWSAQSLRVAEEERRKREEARRRAEYERQQRVVMNDQTQPAGPLASPEEPVPAPVSLAPLERRASMERLEWLVQKGLLNLAGLERALSLAGYIPTAGMWRKFLDYTLLALGTVFTLSGVIFFFAFNWAQMHHFLKFGLIEVTMVLCLGFAYYRGLNTLPGKAGLIAASVLVGALLAVQGQIYQTGADSYWLFFYWTLFITGWAIIGLSGPLWFFWLVLLNLTVLLYGIQAFTEFDYNLFNGLFLLNGLALAVWELGQRRGYSWLQGRWEPRLMALAAFGFVLIPTIGFIYSLRFDEELGGDLILGFLLYLGFIAATFWVYTRSIHDLFMLTLAAFSLIIVITYTVGQEVAEADFDALGLLLIGVIIIIQAALAVNWLQKIARSWEVANG